MSRTPRVIWFRRLALAGALLAAAVVVLGAWVRLTNAGLGCPDWPGCYGHLYPHGDPAGLQGGRGFAKALHEMIHRYFASTLGLIIVSLAAWAIGRRRDPEQPVKPVIALLLLVCVQGALGAFTVTLLLTPLIVTAHLLGGLSTLALLCWLAQNPPPRAPLPHESRLRAFALLGAAALTLQIFLGGWTSTNYAAVACPDLPTCQGAWWPPMDYRDAFVLWRGLGVDFEGGVLANPARVAIQVTHRLGALIAGSVLLALGLAAARSAHRRLKFAGGLLMTAVLVQIGIGMAVVHWGVPLPLATLHNAGAAFLVVSLVTLIRALWPARAAGMVP